MIRVLVVDDSAFMRLALRRLIEQDGDMEVVGEAGDGAAAVAAATRLHPDVIAMDLEMPGMDGLAATEALMRQPNQPAVIIVSKHTSTGSAAALEALAKGAVDYVWKDRSLGGVDFGALENPLREKLRYWASQRGRPAQTAARPARHQISGTCDLVAIGASTGGPDAVAALLIASGPLSAPVVIAQHMPAELAHDFASHLGRRIGRPVEVGVTRQPLAPGMTIVVPGGMDGHVVRDALSGGLALRLSKGEAAVHPSVDLLLRSAAIAARRAIGVVLTGMGRDGAEGAALLAERGMPVLVQDPDSCVVAGMPRAVLASGHAATTGDPAALGLRLSQMAPARDLRP